MQPAARVIVSALRLMPGRSTAELDPIPWTV